MVGRLGYPMRELLGDLLLEQQQPAQALNEYETSFQSTPKDAPKRSQAAKELAKKLGVEVKQVYLSVRPKTF
jgi:hypothetical protein